MSEFEPDKQPLEFKRSRDFCAAVAIRKDCALEDLPQDLQEEVQQRFFLLRSQSQRFLYPRQSGL